jgi:hypothetical protein
MRVWERLWAELREVVWLASIVWGLSILGVALAVALALALETRAEMRASELPAQISHFH